MATKQPERKFLIKQVYSGRVHFNADTPAGLIREQWEPNADFTMDVTDKKVSDTDSDYMVDLTVKATVTIKETKVFTLEVSQTGVFSIEGYNDEQMDRLLKSFCPNILFPYVRQVVTQMTTQAGYPPLNLSPIDFEARYQALQKQKEESA